MTMVAKKDGKVLIDAIEVPDTVFGRMKGLLGRRSLGRGKAMLLSPCSSIHTFGMQFSLDLVFLDRTMRITSLSEKVPPNRVEWGGVAARSVLELETGWLEMASLREGDQLDLS